MARIAKVTTHFVAQPVAQSTYPGASRTVEYAVEKRQGAARWTIGRVTRTGNGPWVALGVGARAWTRWLPSRALAVQDMEAGLTGFDFPQAA